MLENEMISSGHIRNAADGIRVTADGRKITRWKEVRGTHGMDWVYHPTGTDTPPAGYSIAVAKERWEESQQRKRRLESA
jgi:hypothetical protein